ncbi:MAG: DUF3098 domain-containing protein [Flavobacteriales bacterium]|nr:DUF3098 domain-containing protein [Flavobacteriales bacterium]
MAAHNDNEMPFTRENYRLLVIGLGIVVLGFILMAGGGTGDPNAFDPEAIFSPRRITVAPLVALAGYLFIFYAILKRPAR